MPEAPATPHERITTYIAAFSDWRGELLGRLRVVIAEAVPELTEEWKWDVPVWSKRGSVVAVSAFKEHVKLNVFRGAALADPDGLFNSGLDAKNSRGIDFRQGDVLNEAAIKDLIRAAAALNLSKAPK